MIIEHDKPKVELELGDVVRYKYQSELNYLECNYGLIVYVKHHKYNFGILDLESNTVINAHDTLEKLSKYVEILCKGNDVRLIIQ